MGAVDEQNLRSSERKLEKVAETNKRHVVDASSGVFIAGGTFRTIIQTFFLI
jgi:hypothetical protein